MEDGKWWVLVCLCWQVLRALPGAGGSPARLWGAPVLWQGPTMSGGAFGGDLPRTRSLGLGAGHPSQGHVPPLLPLS